MPHPARTSGADAAATQAPPGGAEKLAAVLYGQRHQLPVRQVAGDLGIHRATVYRYRALFRKAPHGVDRIGSEKVPVPPNRRIADKARELVREMKRAGFPGYGSIVGALRHQTRALSERSVGRFLQEPGIAPADAQRAQRAAVRRHVRPAPRTARAASSVIPCQPRPRRLAQAFVEAKQVLGLHLGKSVARMRRLRPQGRAREIDERARLRSRRADQQRILHDYMARIAPRKRPRCTPRLRVLTLALKFQAALSHESVARRVLVDPSTVCDWNVRADSRPVPSLLDLGYRLRSGERAVKRALLALPRLDRALRARLLGALVTLSSEVTPRKRLAKAPSRSTVEREDSRAKGKDPLRPRRPNHYWIGDLTVFTRQGQPDLYLAGFLDAYSRKNLAAQLFVGQPGSDHIATLFKAAVGRYGKPSHFVSDHGGQFTGEEFQAVLAGTGADHRIGAVGQQGSIALIDRFWLTLKTTLDIESMPPLIPELLAERIRGVIHYYDHLRSHHSLATRTPAEVFTGSRASARKAIPLPRGRPGEPCEDLGLEIRFAVVGDQALPYLERIA